jgi:hypothetical protein
VGVQPGAVDGQDVGQKDFGVARGFRDSGRFE